MKDLYRIREISHTAYQFLENFNPREYQDGRINLDNGVYVNIESYETQPRNSKQFEAHKKYIDIQYMIDGEEIIVVAPVSTLTISEIYDEVRDIEFYYNRNCGNELIIKSGEFVVIRPGEGHMPCVSLSGTRKVRKAVMKVPFSSIL